MIERKQPIDVRDRALPNRLVYIGGVSRRVIIEVIVVVRGRSPPTIGPGPPQTTTVDRNCGWEPRVERPFGLPPIGGVRCVEKRNQDFGRHLCRAHVSRDVADAGPATADVAHVDVDGSACISAGLKPKPIPNNDVVLAIVDRRRSVACIACYGPNRPICSSAVRKAAFWAFKGSFQKKRSDPRSANCERPLTIGCLDIDIGRAIRDRNYGYAGNPDAIRKCLVGI